MIAPVVAADTLAALAHDREVVFADVRSYLDGRDGKAAYEAGHLPGAVWVDLDGVLSAHGRAAGEGRHPLPEPSDFAGAMGALGIGDRTVVVAYDDTGGLTAGRFVVMLRMLGRDAALLDGCLTAWVADGRTLASGPAPAPAPAVFTATPWPAERLASATDTIAHAAAGGPVLDARPRERFTGEVVAIDPARATSPARAAPPGRPCSAPTDGCCPPPNWSPTTRGWAPPTPRRHRSPTAARASARA